MILTFEISLIARFWGWMKKGRRREEEQRVEKREEKKRERQQAQKRRIVYLICITAGGWADTNDIRQKGRGTGREGERVGQEKDGEIVSEVARE